MRQTTAVAAATATAFHLNAIHLCATPTNHFTWICQMIQSLFERIRPFLVEANKCLPLFFCTNHQIHTKIAFKSPFKLDTKSTNNKKRVLWMTNLIYAYIHIARMKQEQFIYPIIILVLRHWVNCNNDTISGKIHI